MHANDGPFDTRWERGWVEGGTHLSVHLTAELLRVQLVCPRESGLFDEVLKCIHLN